MNNKQKLCAAKLTRRDFASALGVSALGAAAMPFSGCATSIPFADITPYSASGTGKRWFKGNTHLHTLRSDGEAFPVEAAALFKREGYDFICITDHNVTAAEPFAAFAVESRKGKKVKSANLKAFKRDFPELRHCISICGDGTGAQYTTIQFEKIADMLGNDGRFLVISGNEVTASPTGGNELHCNFLNYTKPCRAKNERTVKECLDWIRGEYSRETNFSPLSMMTVNHPLWVSYDVSPRLVADRPDLRFFEICNSGSMPRFNLPGDEFTHDKWWDIVNTIRAIRGEPLIYGIACDDIHVYTAMRKREKYVAGYVQVLADELAIPSLMEAFYRGDFYASTGMDLESVVFDEKTRTLTVTADKAVGDDCTICFIGSPKGADTSVLETVHWDIEGELNSWLLNNRKFSRRRTVERHSGSIGQTFKTVKGRTASYTLKPDDLYVRAKVFSPANAKIANRENKFPVAWTQPIVNCR
jgi:hypothetical protein